MLSLQIYDPNNARYEVPLDIPSPETKASNPMYEVIWSSDPAFNFQVIRRDTGEVL